MNMFVSKAISTGLFFLFIFLSGFILTRSGKPYHMLLVNIHKLIALGAFVFLAITVYRLNQAVVLNSLQFTALAVTGLCGVIMIITGGLMSIDKTMPAFVTVLHRSIPYLTVLMSFVTLYLLLFRNDELMIG